ncbi:uncharacterized protein METZ01_LOCUS293938, partial [marine metagenome]
MESLQSSLKQILTWFLSPNSLGLEQDGKPAINMMANHIVEGYAVLNSHLNREVTSEVKIASFDGSKYRGEDAEYLSPVLELGRLVNREISEHLRDFLIHGSIA